MMMSPHLAAAALLLATVTAARAETPVGLADLHVADAGRPLTGFVWYPAQPGGTATRLGDTRTLVGTSVVRGAPVGAGVFPLVVLSHGLGGNALNQNWLATDLAAHGMIVAAVNHPGTTSDDVTAQGLETLWNRPADVSRTISEVVGDPAFATHLDAHRIAVIGHSLGGYTALAIGGVQVTDAMRSYCADHTDDGCAEVPREVLSHLVDDRFIASHRDPRVVAVVAMAPGLTPAMTAKTLAAVPVPVLLIAGGHDVVIPVADVRRVAAELPASARYAELPDAAHYDFLPVCKPDGAVLLRAGHYPPLCDGTADRVALHAEVAVRIRQFLDGLGFAAE